jgi:2-C-methyl-D-erythritol 4-phosphate cytidylyltransferase
MAADAAPVGVIIPAAGIGSRLGQGAKAMVQLAGRPMLAHALADVEANRCVESVVVVAHPGALEPVAKVVAEHGFARVAAVVPGGPTRQASVACGLAALPGGPGYVAVHDAARPLAGPGCVDRLLMLLLDPDGAAPGAGGWPRGAGRRPFAAAGQDAGGRLADAAVPLPPDGSAGVVPAVPVTDTVRRVSTDGWSRGIVNREELRRTQTPQLFVRAVLEEAHRLAQADGLEATDEAALVEWAGYRVRVVPGAVENIKVTTANDLLVAETLLARRRAGWS